MNNASRRNRARRETTIRPSVLSGRFAVAWEDLQSLVEPVLRHRVLVNFKGQAEGVTSGDIARGIVEQIGPPKSPLE